MIKVDWWQIKSIPQWVFIHYNCYTSVKQHLWTAAPDYSICYWSIRTQFNLFKMCQKKERFHTHFIVTIFILTTECKWQWVQYQPELFVETDKIVSLRNQNKTLQYWQKSDFSLLLWLKALNSIHLKIWPLIQAVLRYLFKHLFHMFKFCPQILFTVGCKPLTTLCS